MSRTRPQDGACRKLLRITVLLCLHLNRDAQFCSIPERSGVHSRRYLPPTGTNRSGFLILSYSRISSSSSAIQGRFFGSPFLTRTPCSWPST